MRSLVGNCLPGAWKRKRRARGITVSTTVETTVEKSTGEERPAATSHQTPARFTVISLPQELWDEILRHFDTYHELRTIAQVNRAFKDSVARHLDTVKAVTPGDGPEMLVTAGASRELCINFNRVTDKVGRKFSGERSKLPFRQPGFVGWDDVPEGAFHHLKNHSNATWLNFLPFLETTRGLERIHIHDPMYQTLHSRPTLHLGPHLTRVAGHAGIWLDQLSRYWKPMTAFAVFINPPQASRPNSMEVFARYKGSMGDIAEDLANSAMQANHEWWSFRQTQNRVPISLLISGRLGAILRNESSSDRGTLFRTGVAPAGTILLRDQTLTLPMLLPLLGRTSLFHVAIHNMTIDLEALEFLADPELQVAGVTLDNVTLKETQGRWAHVIDHLVADNRVRYVLIRRCRYAEFYTAPLRAVSGWLAIDDGKACTLFTHFEDDVKALKRAADTASLWRAI